jgi:hypothetical protein
MLRRILLVVIATISILAVACSGGGNIEPAHSYDTLYAALESAGMSVDGQRERTNFCSLMCSQFRESK